MDFLFDLYRTARFATRLPLPALKRETDDPIVSADGFAVAFPVVGAMVGAIGAVVILALAALGAPPLMSGLLVVGCLIIITGALHEDGLADLADGIGGGRTRERKLEIMRDSAIGTYGVLALVLSIGLRASAIAALLAVSPWLAGGLLMVTQAASRGLSMGIACQLPHARPDGASERLGRPSVRAAGVSLSVGLVSALAFIVAGSTTSFLVAHLLGMIALTALCMGAFAAWVTRLAHGHLGGQTGDVLGANQQLTDLAGLVIASIYVSALF